MGTTVKLILFLPLLCVCAAQGTSDPQQCHKSGSHPGASRRHSKDWDDLVLAQFWPPAACLWLENWNKTCNIKNLNSWVIHGLWPTEAGSEGPDYCNDSSAFDPSKVQVLQPRLGLNWPTIQVDADPLRLWTREWCKHGTCGTSLPALRDELHYFNASLGLHDRFNLLKILSSGGITPSEDKSYKYYNILDTMRDKAGSKPFLACVRDRTNGKCYLEQVELCVTKSFQPTDCVRPRLQSMATPSGTHDLLFQSETASKRGSLEYYMCHCELEEIYYKPFPSV